jgi:hypothetical protein
LEIDLRTKGFQMLEGSDSMCRGLNNHLPIINVSQCTTRDIKGVHPPVEETIKELHGNTGQTITFCKASTAHCGSGKAVADLKMAGQFRHCPCPSNQDMTRQPEQPSKFKNDSPTETVKGFDHITDYTGQWHVKAMGFLDRLQNACPDKTSMASFTRPKKATRQPII